MTHDNECGNTIFYSKMQKDAVLTNSIVDESAVEMLLVDFGFSSTLFSKHFGLRKKLMLHVQYPHYYILHSLAKELEQIQ